MEEEEKDNNKKFAKITEIFENSELSMTEAIDCIKKKYEFEEKKETPTFNPYLKINDLKCYETKAERL